MSHVLDMLPDYALGVLGSPENETVRAHLSGCRTCSAEADAIAETFCGLAETLAPVAPSPHIRARVLGAVAQSEGGRLSRFAGQLAKFVEIAGEKARALLAVVDDPNVWENGPEGVKLLHFTGGARFATADCGLVRFPAGMDWPLHKHIGPEGMLIFEGTLVEDDGTHWGPGDEIMKEPGTQHSFKIGAESDLVCAVILFEGIEMPPGTPLKI
jgi:anti-sigma factor ChrR (cupin superfamily)